MDVSTQLPTDLLALAAPAGRAPLELLPPGDEAADDSGQAAPFDALLLELAGTAAPTGEALPQSGNGLPSASSDLPSADTPADPAGDPMAASALLAMSAAQLQAIPTEPPPPVTDSSAAAPTIAPAATAPATPDELATLRQLRAAVDPAAPTSTQAFTQPGADASAAPVDPAVGENTAAQPTPAASRAAADTAAQAPAPTAADRAAAALAAAAQSARASDAAPPPPISVARPTGELRTSADRRAPSAATDVAPANAAPLPQVFDLSSAATAGDRPTSAPKAAAASEPLSIVATPTAASAADAVPIAQPHSPSGAAPAAASAALDGSAVASSTASPQHGGSVDTTAARWHDALASRVQRLVDHDVGEARLKLNPPELGALDVKISMHDDKTFVQLTAHNASARDQLAESLPRLRELLSANGLTLGGATVSGGRDEHAGRQQAAAFATQAADSGEIAVAEPAVRSIRGGGSSSRIDLFA